MHAVITHLLFMNIKYLNNYYLYYTKFTTIITLVPIYSLLKLTTYRARRCTLELVALSSAQFYLTAEICLNTYHILLLKIPEQCFVLFI